MRPGSDDLKQVLTDGSFQRVLLIDIMRGPDRLLPEMGCDRWDLRWDREAEIKSSGTLRLVHATDQGSSVSPRSPSDAMAPYGQEAVLRMRVSAGEFSEQVPLGPFRIAAAPNPSDEYATLNGVPFVTSSTVNLTLEDRLSKVKRRGFRSEENPASTSAWDELARISGMGVARNVPDATIPVDLVYKAVKGGRLQGVKTLAGALGGTEYTTYDGLLAVRLDEPDEPVARLRLGEFGVILGDTDGMDSTEVYNVVVGQYEDEARLPIYKIAVAGAPGFEDLADLSPDVIDENTYFQSNPTVKTEAEAEADVAATLYNVARQRRRITVQCILNPLVETGDVVEVERRDGSEIVAQIARISYGSTGFMTIEADVIG